MKQKHASNNGSIDFEPVFSRLNEELISRGQSLALICAGGYVMQLHGFRSTTDIDAFYRSNTVLEAIISEVGEEFGINKPDELWLNNSISNMNPEPPDEHCVALYAFSNLVVKAVTLTYLIGMKLASGRVQDLIDAASILKHDKNEDPFELLSRLNGMKFVVDISVLLDAFEEAYGMDWLDMFYMNNEAELRNYF